MLSSNDDNGEKPMLRDKVTGLDRVNVAICGPQFSGESGAGKTESCKLLVAHLIELNHVKSVLEQRILQASHLFV